jgi:hypothetical protein
MRRQNKIKTYTLTDDIETTARIPFGEHSFGAVQFQLNIGEIRWHHATTKDGPATPIVKPDATPVVSPGVPAGYWVEVPEECAAAAFLVPLLHGGTKHSARVTFSFKS